MLICGGVALREGAVCLAMAAPIFYLVGIFGGVVTEALLRLRRGKAMCVSMLVLPFLGVPAEITQPASPQVHEVVSIRTIAAPPETVWRNLIEVRDIDRRENSWNFSHDVVGVPRPVDARLEGSGVGAARHVEWDRQVHFIERLTEWNPGREMAWTFHISDSASRRILDEHLTVNSDYLRLEEGRYRIEPRADGGTDLILITRYWIRTPMNAYAAWWGSIFLGDFHRNILDVIKTRSEAQA